MRLAIGRVSTGGDTPSGITDWDGTQHEVHGTASRRIALWLSAVLVLGCVGLLFAPAKKAGADTPIFASGQVFASIGGSQVSTFDPSSGSYLTTLTDNSGGNDYTVGSAFDANGNFYVTDDDSLGDNLSQVSEFNSSGTQIATFPGLQNPTSITFDNVGNMYVGQQTTNYIAEFAPDPTATVATATAPAGWMRMPDIGPLTHDYSPGADWIDMGPDECTIYYTSEGTEIFTYNKCTAMQGAVFNQVPFPSTQTLSGGGTAQNQAFELKLLAGGDVLVADSSADLLLNASGSVIQTYPCSSMPSCGGQLFAMSVDPSGQSFWTGDSSTGDIYQINLASGAVMQTITGASGNLYGLSVDNQLEAATPQTTPPTNPAPVLTVIPPTTPIVYGTPTQVSAVLTTSTGQPISGEPVTLTLGGDTCSPAPVTNSQGVATCTITPGGPAGSYTLTATFGGDTSTSTPIPQATTPYSSPLTEGLEPTTLTYTGPTTALNGQTIVPSATLTTNPTSGTPVPVANQPVTFTIGSQTCSGTTNANGVVDCSTNPITLNQPITAESVTTSYNPPPDYYSGATTTTPITVTEPTVLTVMPASGEYTDVGTVTGTLTDGNTGKPIAGEVGLTFTLNGTETCTTTVPTDVNGMASCQITPMEPQGSYTLTGNFGGDTSQPLQLAPAPTGSAPFTENLEETGLALNGAPYSVINTQNLVVSATLTTDEGTVPVAGRSLTFVLGSGATAQTCTTPAPGTDSTGTGTCTITNVNQVVGPVPITVTFAGDTVSPAYYSGSAAQGTVNVGPVQTGTTLSVTNATGDYNDATTVQATLIDNYTGLPAANEPVTITLNGTQSCPGGPVMTNSSGIASCQITPNEKAGSYSLTAAFAGDMSVLPHLEPSTGSGTFVVTHEEATLTYTGATSATNGSSATLSGVLTTDDPAPGTPIAGRTVNFTLGSGTSAQTCSGTTSSTGAASCVIAKVNQTTSPVPVTANFAGDAWFVPASATGSVTISTPTTLSVTATSGTYGQPTTISGTLTNSVTGAPISGQTVTLTLNGTQTCTAVTNSKGQASCSITPNEPSGSYTVSGTFGGGTNSTTLLPSSGHNCFVVNQAPTIVTYTGQTSASSGQTLTLSSTLTTSSGAPISGQTVVETLGSGRSAQSCTAVTNSSGVASCTITVNQVYGTGTVTVSYGGNTYYQSSSSTSTENIGCGGGGGGGGGSGGGGPCGGGAGGGGGCGGGTRPPCGGSGCGGGGCGGGGQSCC